ncbi:50S ribosomal protein L21e [Thermoproteus tenax]|uniref:Large ribosomal subunit protein eL21 n=1 Tax=Thermoproteus tenax (strain ATCC 35583 / DSM 2078 / JCM 9277 / NBRC 100435 / Kra 1) TaxID=768679 RepID=G4RML7_THETK|nr:50S ribosomal protein L21e [Thermoproteus tenax]CCC82693.1 50S ribosomal protein L21e [Thermoproteus tenax Kra 1]
MPKRTHGYRYKSRKLLSKGPRERGPGGLSRLMYEYKEGDRVVIDIDPTYITNAPHRRYQGRVGLVVGRQGAAYIVLVEVGSKVKKLVVPPEHLVPFRG